MEEEDAEEVEGCTRDEEDSGDDGVDLATSDFSLDDVDGSFSCKYLELSWEVFVSLLALTSLTRTVDSFLMWDLGLTGDASSEDSELVELEHFCSFSFIISSLTTF